MLLVMTHGIHLDKELRSPRHPRGPRLQLAAEPTSGVGLPIPVSRVWVYEISIIGFQATGVEVAARTPVPVSLNM